MQSKNLLRHILAVVVMAIPLVYIALIWSSIPETVALHFNVSGQPDDFGSKNNLMMLILFTTGVTLVAYFLAINVHLLDKKRTKGIKPPNIDTIAFGIAVFITIINLVIIQNGIHPDVPLFNKVLIPVMGLFFVFLGNMMYNIKPNRFVGIRVPWTLNDEDNWKKTHQLGGKLFFAGGILITLVSLGYKTEIAAMFMSGVILFIAAVCILYSYMYYRTTQKSKEL